MALKDGARTWLLNLAPGTISSWDEMGTRFITNFQGTHDRPPAMSDLRRIKQQPGVTLQKFIQRYNNARLKIPKVSEEAIISALSWETNTYGAGPVSVRQGAEAARRADRGEHTSDFYPASELSREIILLLLLCGCIMFLLESVGVSGFE